MTPRTPPAAVVHRTVTCTYCGQMTGRPPSVVIIGAGFGGIGLGALLRRAGIGSFVILEKDSALGGTWRDNTYPGAACDVPSHLYCYSFAPNPRWSRRYAPQQEILDYLTGVATRFGVRDHIRYGCEVAAAEWSDKRREWLVTLADGRTMRADVVVSAVGQLHRPAIPDLPGLGSFTGTAFHSARWPPGLDLSGKRVGVLGTAASAVQIVPAIAPTAEHVTVFQRSPNWILPRGDRRYRGWEQRLFTGLPVARQAYRTWIWSSYEARFPALRGNRLFAGIARRLLDRHLGSQVPDPALRRTLTPDYPVGARRVLSADDYYPALRRPDVDLVTQPVERIEPAGVMLAGGRHIPLDVLVLATGFRSTEFLVPMRVTGRRGKALSTTWESGPSAHLGVSVPGFPNLFLMYGPNTNLGHNSILFMLECQARHIVALLDRMRHGDMVEVRQSAFTSQRDRLHRALDRSVWSAADRSWYKDATGRITNNWGSTTVQYWWQTRRAASRDYALTRSFAKA